jgi:hypothetical protein
VKTLLLFAVTTLVGCATVKVAPDHAVLINGHPRLEIPAPGQSRITVVRDAGFFGSACSISVSIDGESVGSLRTQQRVDAYVDPGEHVVEISTAEGLCGNFHASASCLASNGVPKAFRVGYPSGGDLAILPIAP